MACLGNEEKKKRETNKRKKRRRKNQLWKQLGAAVRRCEGCVWQHLSAARRAIPPRGALAGLGAVAKTWKTKPKEAVDEARSRAAAVGRREAHAAGDQQGRT